MKILYHHRIRSRDGQYVHLSELVAALKALGHDVLVVGPSIVDRRPFESGAGWVGRLRTLCPPTVYELLELAYSCLDFLRLIVALRRFRPDFVYERYNLYLWSGVLASKLIGRPLILEVNAPLVEERSRYGGLALRRLARLVEDYTWNNADTVLPVTGVLAGMIAERGVPRERIHVVWNGINLADITGVDRTAARRELMLHDDDVVLGFVGFVRDWHGLHRVVRLLARAGNERCRFLVVGDGPAREELERHAADSGVADRVTITGIVSQQRAIGYISAFDVALQPDVVDYASPLKLVEYLALGRPIVAPDRPNIREVLRHGENGLLFPPGDQHAFEDAVLGLCQDGELRRRLGEAACRTVRLRGLTWTRNAGFVIERARELIQAQRQREDRPA
jgi:glycosyltransferase involved in cell wall biosynthesis